MNDKKHDTWGYGAFENTRGSNWLYEFNNIVSDNITPMLATYLKQARSSFADNIYEPECRIGIEHVHASLEMLKIIGTHSPVMISDVLMDLASQCAQDILTRDDWFNKFDDPSEIRIKITSLHKWIRDNRWACSFEPIIVNKERIRRETKQMVIRKESKETMRKAKEAQQKEADEMAKRVEKDFKSKEATRTKINREQRGLKL